MDIHRDAAMKKTSKVKASPPPTYPVQVMWIAPEAITVAARLVQDKRQAGWEGVKSRLQEDGSILVVNR